VAGLPNVTGSFGLNIVTQGEAYPSGCLAATDGGYSVNTASGSEWRARSFDFYASRSSSIYGSSETVTPLSMSCIFCIKY
jgi:hypothetical protein